MPTSGTGSPITAPGPSRGGRSRRGKLLQLDLIATPWERARARRLNRLFIAEAARIAEVEPWQRDEALQQFLAAGLAGWLRERPETFPLLALFQPLFRPYQRSSDRNEVERRATLLYLAVREWQLRHGGKLPDQLGELVPEELPSLPLDPYTGRPFGYTTFAKGNTNRPAAWPRINWPPDTRLIYSAGTDGQDNGGEVYSPGSETPGDMVFPIPSEPARPGELEVSVKAGLPAMSRGRYNDPRRDLRASRPKG